MVIGESNALTHRLRNDLKELHRQLSIAQSGISLATQFLRNQDADQDCDVANILEQCVDNCLSKQIERMDVWIAELKALPTGPVSVESTGTA